MSVLLIGSSHRRSQRGFPRPPFRKAARPTGARSRFWRTATSATFGTIYDIATIATLWFAGSSAMAGLLNLVPQYLPRYGMAPDWARATRPLVVLITAICFFVTISFRADVDAQGGAYATGVLMLMTSSAVAVYLALPASRHYFLPVSLVFIYTVAVNIWQQPDGIEIAAWFIVTIIAASLVSRVMRSTEIRIEGVDYDDVALGFIREAAGRRSIRIIASRPNTGSKEEYQRKFNDARHSHHLPPGDVVLFLEVRPGRRLGVLGHAARAGRHGRRLSHPALQEPGDSERDCRPAARSARSHLQHSARVLRLDRGQPDHVSAAIPRIRRRRHGAGLS